jgi:hypothetical protein
MSVGGRVAKAIIYSIITGLIYIYIPTLLFNFLQAQYMFNISSTNLGITLGNVALMEEYLLMVGYIIVGLTFASNMAVKGTRLYYIWNFAKIFMSIVFWASFISAKFDTYNFLISTGNGIVLDLTLTITIFFYSMMGAYLFQLVIVILNFIIGYERKEIKHDRNSFKGSSATPDNYFLSSVKEQEVT